MKPRLTPTELRLLSLVTHERTGREVARLHKKETRKAIAYGTLYTTFRRLKESGYVLVREQGEGDGRERLFKISARGVTVLERSRAFYRDLASFGLPDPNEAG